MASFDQIVALTDFVPSTTARSSEVDANFALLRDEFNKLVTAANTLNVDTVDEVTSANGVVVDSVTLKDGGATLTAALSVGADVLLTGTPQLFLNETAHGQQTIGITINQGAADDLAFAVKSSDVATGLSTIVNGAVETDDFFALGKVSAAEGGALLQGLAEDAAVGTVLLLEAYGGTATTAKDTTARALAEVYVAEHDGANALANITVDGNVFGVRARVGAADVMRWLVDEDGDTWQSGGITATTGVFSGALSIDDATDATSAVTGSIQTDGGLGIVKALWVGTTARLVGAVTCDSTLSATAITGSGVLSIDDVTDSTSGTTGSIHTDGGLGVVKDIAGGNDLLLTSSGAIINFNAGDMLVTHSANTLTVSGGTWATAALTATTITGSGVLSIDDVTDTTSTITGSIHTDGGVGIAKALWVGTTSRLVGAVTCDSTVSATAITGSGILSIDDTTDTTSKTTGSIHTDGGLGVAKNLWVGVKLTVEPGTISSGGAGGGDLTLSSDATNGNIILTPKGTGATQLGSQEVYIGDTANANMAIGLTINQGANDTEILNFKSSDVAHGMTSYIETDSFAGMYKQSATEGGLFVRALSEGAVALEMHGYATTEDATKTAAATGAIVLSSSLKSGTGITNITANNNLLTIEDNNSTRFLVDADGDWHYDGADGGAFDPYDDGAFCRAVVLHTANPADLIRSRFDRLVQYGEPDLVKAKILGAPVRQGGLVNGAQVQRLLLGSAAQAWMERHELREENAALRKRLGAVERLLAA